jgi:hypothetical protein
VARVTGGAPTDSCVPNTQHIQQNAAQSENAAQSGHAALRKCCSVCACLNATNSSYPNVVKLSSQHELCDHSPAAISWRMKLGLGFAIERPCFTARYAAVEEKSAFVR